MRYFVTIGSRTFEVDLSDAVPTVDGTPLAAELATVPGTRIRSLLVDGHSHSLIAQQGEQEDRWELTVAGQRLSATVVDERTRTIRAMTGASEETAEKSVTAPMPGMVVRVEVEPGQRVAAGQGVVIVEAMKMENELKAPADGVVASVAVQPGQTVEKGAVLIVLE